MFLKPIACLLFAVPVAWVLAIIGKKSGGIEHGSIAPVWHFLANFFAIIPLSWLISECTEQLEKKVGPMLGALLNSTFGNVVEIILSITAILQGKYKIVQSALLGAMIMNILGVLGICFFVAGNYEHSQKFNTHQATYNLALMAIATLGVSVPTGLADFDEWSKESSRLWLSRMVAGCLFLMYVQWIVFNLCTHAGLFDKRHKKTVHWYWHAKYGQKNTEAYENLDDAGASDAGRPSSEEDDGDDEAEMNCFCAVALLFIATVIVAFHCDWLVEAINPVCKEYNVKEAFVATVILPMVGNFSEVIAAVNIACKGKLDLAMGVAIGSATQIAMCVIPVAVFIAWAAGRSLDLDFEVFQVRMLYLAVVVVGLLLMDGEANWLKGSMLMTTYVLVCSAFWFLTNNEFKSGGRDPFFLANSGVNGTNVTR
jgi:Ca2+:H+ antiporter